MPNPWTGIGNPYTRTEVLGRLHDTLAKGQVKDMGFSGVNNFPTHTIVDGQFRQILEETGMSVKKEFEMIALARRMDLFSIVYVGNPAEAVEMAKAGADAIITPLTAEGPVAIEVADQEPWKSLVEKPD